MQGEKSEAARVIFLGWPGQHELDDEEGPHTPPGGREASPLDGCLQLPPLMSKSAATTAQPPLALNADCVRAQNGRQLGFASFLIILGPVFSGFSFAKTFLAKSIAILAWMHRIQLAKGPPFIL